MLIRTRKKLSHVRVGMILSFNFSVQRILILRKIPLVEVCCTVMVVKGKMHITEVIRTTLQKNDTDHNVKKNGPQRQKQPNLKKCKVCETLIDLEGDHMPTVQ